MQVKFRAPQLLPKKGFYAAFAFPQTRLPRTLKSQRAPMSRRSRRWEHPSLFPSPPARTRCPGAGGCSRPRCHLLPVHSQAWTRAAAPRYVPGLGAALYLAPAGSTPGRGPGPPSEFLSLGSSTCPGAIGSSCSQDIPARPPQPRVNANRSWVKPETGLPGVKICTIYSCANASEKRGLSLFNQFSGRRLPHPLLRSIRSRITKVSSPGVGSGSGRQPRGLGPTPFPMAPAALGPH